MIKMINKSGRKQETLQTSGKKQCVVLESVAKDIPAVDATDNILKFIWEISNVKRI